MMVHGQKHPRKRMDSLGVGAINLADRPTRWEHIQQNWVRSGVLPQVQRLEAVRFPQRHRGCSLSHTLHALAYFDAHPDRDMYLIIEDDATPLRAPYSWRAEVSAMLADLTSISNWKAVVLSPLVGPGLVRLRKHALSARLSVLEAGDNLSTAAILYHRRCVPHLRGWKQYYSTERRAYLVGIDRMMMRLPRDEVLLASMPLVEQRMTFPSDNPASFSQRIAIPAQNTSHNILAAARDAPSARVVNSVFFWAEESAVLLFASFLCCALADALAAKRRALLYIYSPSPP